MNTLFRVTLVLVFISSTFGGETPKPPIVEKYKAIGEGVPDIVGNAVVNDPNNIGWQCANSHEIAPQLPGIFYFYPKDTREVSYIGYHIENIQISLERVVKNHFTNKDGVAKEYRQVCWRTFSYYIAGQTKVYETYLYQKFLLSSIHALGNDLEMEEDGRVLEAKELKGFGSLKLVPFQGETAFPRPGPITGIRGYFNNFLYNRNPSEKLTYREIAGNTLPNC